MFGKRLRNCYHMTTYTELAILKEIRNVLESFTRQVSGTSNARKLNVQKPRCPYHGGTKINNHLRRGISEIALEHDVEAPADSHISHHGSHIKSYDEIPGPKGLPGVGNLLKYGALGPYSLEKIFANRAIYYKKYGKIYKEHLGPMKMVHLFDPEEAMKIFGKEGPCPNRGAQMAPVGSVYAETNNKPYGLVFKNGEDWINQRKLIQKLMMDPTAANPYLKQQNQIADDFVEIVGKTTDNKDEVNDLLHEMMRYTMESIAGVCFNTRLGCLEENLDAKSDAMRMIKAVTVHFKCLHKSTFSFPWVKYFKTPLYYRYARAGRVMESIASEHIKQTLRRISRKDAKEDCLMSYLARNSDMPLNEMVALTLNFFEAGIDSTAKCMTFMMYNLAKNPSKQEILYEEIESVIGNDQYVTARDINNMPYLRACMKESFRVNYPVYAGLARMLSEDIELCGYNIPKGTFIQVNNATMCKMEEFFPDANEFIPERWLRDREDPHHVESGGESTETGGLAPQRSDRGGLTSSLIMLPFGFGIRNCIGKRFAEQEILLAIIKMVRQYKLEYHHGDVGMINEIFTKPDRAVKVRFVPRSRVE